MLQMEAGKWFDREGKRAVITQYHEVIGDLLGRPAQITVQVMVPGAAVLHAGRQSALVVVHCCRLSAAPVAVQVIIVISLVGTNSAQIVASASDAYYLDSSRSKRWAPPFLPAVQLQTCLVSWPLLLSVTWPAAVSTQLARGMCSLALLGHVYNESRFSSRHMHAAQPCTQLLLLYSHQGQHRCRLLAILQDILLVGLTHVGCLPVHLTSVQPLILLQCSPLQGVGSHLGRLLHASCLPADPAPFQV